ncbi:hypothetical protein HH212_22880 [Massilia forsythiae]|uniref:Uncharacterized protein n=1 Tax=Massilia forsythiae TaxID=2728020 RepID=A0A7Z2W132_9BURK|nr:hypothetical protein [Massilia forsythiae]QJE02512.1 hypothetical protein HH212_22880 [Massilia forsythiae]
MANEKDSHGAVPPKDIPPRRFHEDMKTVLMLASVFNYGAAKLAEQANIRSQLEWEMDMDWLDDMQERWTLSTGERIDFEDKFRQRHRDTWGEFAYAGN